MSWITGRMVFDESNIPNASFWRYRIEGGQKMVFFCDSSSAKPLLRDVSATRTRSHAASGLPRFEGPFIGPQILVIYPTLDKFQVPIDDQFSKPQALIEKHLSPFLIPPHPITLTPPFLATLAEAAQPHRPTNRTSKITASCNIGALQTDAALYFGPNTRLVEIKPKYAHLSRSRLIPPEHANVLKKYQTLTYHIKNYILPDHAIPANPYNPNDLLSANYHRIIRAFGNMVSHQSRSLRIFEAGKQIETSDFPKYIPFMRVAAASLATYNEASQAIKTAQSYDILDLEGAELVMKRLIELVGEKKATELVRREMYVDSPYEEVFDKLCYETPRTALAHHNQKRYGEAVQVVNKLTELQCARLLSRYLQAAAAKDLSLLIAIAPRANMRDVTTEDVGEQAEGIEGDVVSMDGQLWLSKMFVVDVGEKSVEKICDRWGPEERRRVNLLKKRNADWEVADRWTSKPWKDANGDLVTLPFW